MENPWIWNVLPTVLIAVIGWLLLRFIKGFDTKIAEIDQKATHNSNRLHELENTNVTKVDELKKMVIESEYRLLKKIEAVIEDKNNYRFNQIRQITNIETKQNGMIEILSEIKKRIFKE